MFVVCCVWVQIMYKFAAHAAVAPVCSAVKQLLRRRVRRVLFLYLLLLKKCGPSGRRRRSVLMRG